MSWYDPRDWDKKKAISTGVGLVLGGPVGAYAGYKYGPAVINGIGDAAEGIGNAFGDAAKKIDSEIHAPFAAKEKGLTDMQAKLDALKQERLARMDALYGRANSQYDDTRAAISAAYGDPRSWKL